MTLTIKPSDLQYLIEMLLEESDNKELVLDLLSQWRGFVKKNRIPQWAIDILDRRNALVSGARRKDLTEVHKCANL
jgi:hypothetical protein